MNIADILQSSSFAFFNKVRYPALLQKLSTVLGEFGDYPSEDSNFMSFFDIHA